MGKLLFFRGAKAGLGIYHTGGYGRIGVYRVNLFQSDVHSLIDKLFSSGSHRFTDTVKCAIFLCLGSLCHVGQQSVCHGRVSFNASLVRPGNVCHIGQQMSVMDLCFSTFHLYPDHLSHVGQQRVRHRVVFSTLGLYACPFSQAGQQIVHQGLACSNLPFLPHILKSIHSGV